MEARQALALSLALHELATNATKYGALSNEAGRVSISWQLDPTGPDADFRLEWKEHGGPAVETPARTGFGSRMIERSLAGYLNGSARIFYEFDGLRYALEAPPPDLPAV